MSPNRLSTRREFLAAGAAGMAGAALLPACSRSQPSEDALPRTGRSTLRALGRTGLELPVISMGSVYAVELVRGALDAGIVYIHTSSSYAERNHERLLGEVLKSLPRSSFIVASSPDLPYRFRRYELSDDLGTAVDPALIAESIDGSLQRLGIDVIDIYYLASISRRRTALHEPYLEAFGKLKAAGKVRFAGITTHANEPEVIRAAAESKFWDVVLTAYNFRQSYRGEVRAAIRQAAEAGLGVVAMKTQAGVYWDGARKHKINMKAALKWVLQDEHVHTTIPAFANFDEMREDLSVMKDLAFTPQEEQDLRLGEQLGLSGLYCQQCAHCVPQCPAGLDIPTLMRGYMYATGYQDPARAMRTAGSRVDTGIPCVRCRRCPVRCALGFDVKSRALDMARLLAVSG
jgi:predicted aldo/keto reductase-like oxidoreductase